MNNKLKNTRLVTFTEDYFSAAQLEEYKRKKEKNGWKDGEHGPSPIYAKGSTHPIHFKTVEVLKKKGAKMSIKEVSEKMISDHVKTLQEE